MSAIFYGVDGQFFNINHVTAIERVPATSSSRECVRVSFIGGDPILLEVQYEGFMKRFGKFLERIDR